MRYTPSLIALILLAAAVLNISAAAGDDDIRTISSVANDLSYDSNNKLRGFHLLVPEGNSCQLRHLPIADGYYETEAVTGEALKQVFPEFRPGDCRAACVERGTDRAQAGYTMPHLHFSDTTPDKFNEWFDFNCRAQETCLMNYYNPDRPLSLYWMNPDTQQPQLHLEISYGNIKTRCFNTFLGHEFIVKDGETELDRFTIEYSLVKAFGESPPSDNPDAREFEQEIIETLENEWTRHNVVKRTFSPLGFQKGRLPNDVFASMGAFYYNNRHHKVFEEWGDRGVFVNWYESSCSFIQIPWKMKETWQSRLRDLVSAWAGVEVEQTVMYGLRQYEHGARLLTHVDREATHAVSLIVNVAQGNLTEPWPVEVFDHADRLHEVIMQPGDIVYYESAKNLHSRNRPLQGTDAYYVNLFTHYRPVGDGDHWYLMDNHEGTPPAVTEDVKGSCRLEPAGTTATGAGSLGMVQAVQCDDERLGPYISPTLFQAKGPQDLIDWWRQTGLESSSSSTTTSSSDESKEEL